MGLPEINRARIEKLNHDVTDIKEDVSALQGEVESIDPIVTDESFENVIPPTPSNVRANALFRNIQVMWTYNSASYIAKYEVYASRERGFTPRSETLIWQGRSGAYNHRASTGETWYFRVRAVNTHDEPSEFSDEVSATTTSLEGFEIDEQYKIDLLEEANLYTEDRKAEIMTALADKADYNYVYNNLLLKADAETVDDRFDEVEQRLLGKVDTEVVTIIQNELAEKVDAEWVNGQLVTKADANTVYTITEVDGLIDSTVKKTEYETDQNNIVTRFENAESRISQTEEAIESTVSKEEYNALEGRVGTAETTITQHAESIASKAEQETVDLISGDVETLSSTVEQHAGLIESKVEQVTYNQDKEGIIGRLDANETAISQNAEAIELRATKDELIPIGNKVTEMEGTLTVHSEAIEQRVTQATYDKDINDEENGLIARMNSAEASITTHAGQIELKASQEEVDTRIGDVVHRLDSAEGTISVHSDAIEQRVTKETYNALEGRVSTAEGSISTLAGEVELKASQSDLDASNERLSEAESTLSVLPGQIESKVEKDGIISTINQSPEEVKIDASRLSVTGDLIVDGIANLNEAIIDSVHIKDKALVGRMFADGVITNEMIAQNAQIDFAKIGNVQITSAMIDELDAGKLNAGVLNIDNVTIQNDKVTMDSRGVTVKEADFLMKDNESDTESKLIPMTNFIKDHSFELVEPNWDVWHPDGSTDIAFSNYWSLFGSPRIISNGNTDVVNPLVMYGNKSVVVNSSHYVYKRIPFMPSGTYTVSAYFRRAQDATTSHLPQIFVQVDAQEYLGAPYTRVVNTSKYLDKHLPWNYDVVRLSLTFTIPDNADFYDYDITLGFRTAGASWAVLDGVQLVYGSEYPTTYDAEDTAWDLAYDGISEWSNTWGDNGTRAWYLRYNNGLQLCWGIFSVTGSSLSWTNTTHHRYASAVITLPASYIDSDFHVIASPEDGQIAARSVWIPYSRPANRNQVTVFFASHGTSTSGLNVRLHTMGQWKY